MYLDDYIIFKIFSFILPNCKYNYKNIINLKLCSKTIKKMILNFYKGCIVFRIEKKNKKVLGFKKSGYCLKHSKIPIYIFTQIYSGSLSPLSRSIPYTNRNILNNFNRNRTELNLNTLNTIGNGNNYFRNSYYIHFDKLSHSEKFIELVKSKEINLNILHQCCQGLGFRVKYFK